MATVVLTDIILGPPVRVRFNDGSEFEYTSFADLESDLAEVNIDIDLAKKLCMAYAKARSNDLTNINSVKDKNFIFDIGHPNPIRVQ